jgi:ABC-type nickel/cobalt efflux system permease component RcnA
LLQEIAALQQEIYRVLAGEIRTFAGEGSWFALAAFVPLGIAFGAVHALMPGHGKSVLALYLAGSPASLARGLATALALSLTHVGMSVLIVLFALPVVSFVLGSAGRAPLLEDISRGLLGLIGIWMLYRAVRRPVDRHHAAEGVAVGAIAGLVPCPLTLFVMTYSVSRGAPGAGLAFAAIMMIGVAVTLCFVAWASIFARQGLLTLIAERPALVDRTMRSLEGCAGVVFLAIAVFEFL